MHIEYIRAKNFFCIGEEPLEIDFSKLGNTVLIQGKNLDLHNNVEGDSEYSESGDEYHSNASGKSTISEIIVYALYGSTIRKKVSHTQAINRYNKKKLEVEIVFTINNVKYRIERTRQPDSLRLWQDGPPWTDDNEITRGGQPATQSQIEEILGMTHKAFINVVCFGQHNEYNFLECTAAEQREIAESLLSLEVYKKFSATAKEDVKELKSSLKESSSVYEQICESESSCLQRIAKIKSQHQEWLNTCNQEIQDLKSKQNFLKEELEKTDIGNLLLHYEQSQKEILDLKSTLPEKQKSKQDLENAITNVKLHYDKARENLHELSLTKKSLEREIADLQRDRSKSTSELNKLNDLPSGAKCPHCYSVIDKQHYKHVMQLHQNKIDSIDDQLNLLTTKLQSNTFEIDKVNKSLNKVVQLKDAAQQKLEAISQGLEKITSRISNLSKVQKPDLTSKEMLIREKINQAQDLINSKQSQLESGGPYLAIVEESQKDLYKVSERKAQQKAKIEEIESSIPYHEYWVKAFGDDGIRAFIIERIVPALNARIAYWMQYLSNGKMKVSFDKYLNASIECEPYSEKSLSYAVTCGSERKRINLAISQAFAHVMMISSGTWPSLVFLDEVSDSIDQRGIRSIYQMICELANEKQVFVITHNINLRHMLDGVDTITMIKEGGFTRKI